MHTSRERNQVCIRWHNFSKCVQLWNYSYQFAIYNRSSSCNMDEVNAVLDLVIMLLKKDNITQSDIGIVSPYKLQCKIIKQRCDKNNYKKIVIGPAEVFQGQEKPVIIVSTVRSGRVSLGDFLQNAQVCYLFNLTLANFN